jgi:hypothetical protein
MWGKEGEGIEWEGNKPVCENDLRSPEDSLVSAKPERLWKLELLPRKRRFLVVVMLLIVYEKREVKV